MHIEVIRDFDSNIVDFKKINSDGSDIYDIVPQPPVYGRYYTKVQVAKSGYVLAAFEEFNQKQAHIVANDIKLLLKFLASYTS